MTFFEVVKEYRWDGETHEAFFEQESEAVAYVRRTMDLSACSADVVIIECAFGASATRSEKHRFKEISQTAHACICPACTGS